MAGAGLAEEGARLSLASEATVAEPGHGDRRKSMDFNTSVRYGSKLGYQ